ncbi:MAG: hypothetical protein JSV72_03025 [Ralstonia sp.]|jgi:hypothetical protein|nr:MAG: hypothetical protein JSV72_03025 [Ralstonia sp.]
MRTLNRLSWVFLSVVFVLAALFFGLAAYSEYEETPCGMYRVAKYRLLGKLTPDEAAALQYAKSIAEPECPDIFRFRYKGRDFELTASDIVFMGEPRPPR